MQYEARVQDAALLMVRVVVAAIFLYAGSAKWTFWSVAPEGMSEIMLSLMKLLSIVEPLGSIALIVGFLTRWAASGLGIIMIGAIVVSRMTYGAHLFTNPEGTGLDYNFLLLSGCMVLVAFGSGRWSVDAVSKRAKASGRD